VLSTGMFEIPLTCLTPPCFVPVPSQDTYFQDQTYVVIFCFVSSEWRWPIDCSYC